MAKKVSVNPNRLLRNVHEYQWIRAIEAFALRRGNYSDSKGVRAQFPLSLWFRLADVCYFFNKRYYTAVTEPVDKRT